MTNNTSDTQKKFVCIQFKLVEVAESRRFQLAKLPLNLLRRTEHEYILCLPHKQAQITMQVSPRQRSALHV